MPKGRWWKKLNSLFGRGERAALRALPVLFLLIVIGISLRLIAAGAGWRIERIICDSDGKKSCPKEVEGALSAIKGMSSFSLSVPRILASIEERFGYISDISIKQRGLGFLVVGLKVDEPAVAVTLGEFGRRWYLLSKKGVVINESDDPAIVPRLHLSEEEWKFSNHRLVSPYAAQALPFLVMVGEKFSGVEARITKLGDLELSLLGLRVLVSLEKDPSVSAATLQLLLAEPTIQDNKPKVIDLRFQNITLSY